MKKMWLLLLVVMAAFVLTACQKEYAVDGDFTAYAIGTHDGPQVTYVTVTIEDGKIAGFDIDVRQGDIVQSAGADTTEDTTDDEYKGVWNELTKKELEDDYNMVTYGGAEFEWYEQAEKLEAYWLENGVTLDEVDEDGYIDVVAGVSITVDSMYEVALEAIELAKAGTFQAITCVDGSHGAELYSAVMNVEKGKFSDVVVDALQSSSTVDTFSWNDETKWELGFDYGMSAVTDGLEWFEQAEDIADYVEANGWSSSSDLDGIASVSITTDDFAAVLDALFALPAGEIEPA